jgi:hypothetical protein
MESSMMDFLRAGTMLMSPEEFLVCPLPDDAPRLSSLRHTTDLGRGSERRTVMIIASDAPVKWLREGDILNGGSVLPDFTCGVSELFEGVAR